MTTSGVSSYNPDFDEIILEAYERCGLQVRDGYDARTARRSLNLMFAEWANRGLNLWTIEQHEVILEANVHEYTLAADTVDALSAVIRTNAGTSNQQDITIDRIGSAEYLHVPNKFTPSRPAQYYVQRTVPAKLFLYPAPVPSLGTATPNSKLRCMRASECSLIVMCHQRPPWALEQPARSFLAWVKSPKSMALPVVPIVT